MPGHTKKEKAKSSAKPKSKSKTSHKTSHDVAVAGGLIKKSPRRTTKKKSTRKA